MEEVMHPFRNLQTSTWITILVKTVFFVNAFVLATKTTAVELETSSTRTTTTTTSIKTTSSICAPGWDFSSKTHSCYFIPKTNEKTEKKSWKRAEEFCANIPINGSEVTRLVDVTSAEEQKFLEETLEGYEFTSKEDYWTAGHDFINEGEWQWYGTNLTHTSANYSNWDVENGQPDKGSIWNQDCLFIGQKERFQFRWHDNSCTYPCFYICEYSPLIPPPEPSASASSSSASSSSQVAIIVVIVLLLVCTVGLLLFFLLLFLARRRQREYRRPGQPGVSHSEIFGAMTVEDETPPAPENDEPKATTTLTPRDLMASFRRGFGWQPVGETDRRTLVENIVISIENDVGGRDGEEGEEGGVGTAPANV